MHRQPLKLLSSEEFETSPEARKRELYWKNGGDRRKLFDIYQFFCNVSVNPY